MLSASLFSLLILLLIFILLSNAVTTNRDQSILFSRTTIQSLLSLSYLSWANIYINPVERGIGLFGGLFHVTIFTQTFTVFIILVSATILSLNAFYPRKLYSNTISSLSDFINSKLLYNKYIISNKAGETFRIIEYPLIIIFIILGGLFLISTNDLVSMFLAIELQSYGLYILSTIHKNSEPSTAGGLTYFLLGGLSSCFILLGSALLYINSGTTSLENIYVITNLSEITMTLTWYGPYYLHLSLIVLSVGFLFKISAAPFHSWSPDVYDGIPTVVTIFVAIIAKLSIFGFFLELVYYTGDAIFSFTWKNILLLSSLLSLVIGSVLGLTQSRIKRLYAYSTINHVGFILLALSITTTESIQSYIFYILQYTLGNLNAFLLLITIGYSLYSYVYNTKQDISKPSVLRSLSFAGGQAKPSDEINDQRSLSLGKTESKKQQAVWGEQLIDRNNSPIQLVSQIKGYFMINPYVAISLAITLFSFAGVPPMIGFFGKQMILSAALDSGYIFMALVAILTSVISAAYYLNLIKEIFFFKTEYSINPSIKNIKFYVARYTNKDWFSTRAWIRPNPISQSGVRVPKKTILNKEIKEDYNANITLNSSLTTTISILTLVLVLFIYIPEEWFNMVNIITLILFKA